MGKMVRKIAEDPAITALKRANTPPPQPKLVQDYFKSEFYDPMAKGTQAIIPVKLPTGEEYKFVGGAPLVGFQEYLKSIDEMPAAIIGAKEGKPEYRYPTFFEQREGSDVQPYITSQNILSKEAYKERLEPISFLTTLPSYVGTLQQPRTPEVPRVPRLPRNTNFFDFLSPDFSRRRSLLSESEAEERIPVGMKDGGRIGFANGGSLDEFLKSTTLVSPSGKNYNYDFIKSLPGTPQAAAQKFGREAIYGTTVNAGDNDITTPGKYASYYNLADEGSLKQEYSFLKDYILQPENLVRDYGLQGAIKILTPYRKEIAPAPAPKATATPTSKETLDFLATLPSAMNTAMSEVIKISPPPPPRIPTITNFFDSSSPNTNFFDFLSPDFARRRSLLSESEAEERTPINMKDGGIMNLKMGGVPMEMDYRQSGGFVPLGAKEKADDVPARLSKNEFVMTADAVRGMGQGDINKGAQRMYDIMNTYETIGRSLA